MAVATDYKISDADVASVHVESQPTVLNGTATQNKQVFDKYSDLIKDRFNSLCDLVDEDTSAVVDNSVKQYYHDVLGWTADE